LVASSSEPVAAAAELPADPVLAELEAALAMRRAGADPKALRRALRRIEELLDE
jgi:citrate lyase beta subunit